MGSLVGITKQKRQKHCQKTVLLPLLYANLKEFRLNINLKEFRLKSSLLSDFLQKIREPLSDILTPYFYGCISSKCSRVFLYFQTSLKIQTLGFVEAKHSAGLFCPAVLSHVFAVKLGLSGFKIGDIVAPD